LQGPPGFHFNAEPRQHIIFFVSIRNWQAEMARAYFDEFREFDYDETAALIDEFQRLAICRRWATNGKTYRKQRQKCLGQAFEEHFGNGEKNLQGWQSLCEEVNIQGPPASITQCKKVPRTNPHCDTFTDDM
jgi:hypothetical protein